MRNALAAAMRLFAARESFQTCSMTEWLGFSGHELVRSEHLNWDAESILLSDESGLVA